jgi:hypothetical protein
VPPAADSRQVTTSVTETLVARDFAAPAELTIVSRYDGKDADSARRDFRARGRDSIAKSYLDFYRRNYPTIRAAAPLTFQDDRPANVFTTSERYSLPDLWTAVSNPQRREVELYLSTVGSYVSQPRTTERSTPLAVQHPVHVRHVTEALLPDGQRFESDAWSFESRDVSFRYAATGSDGHLNLEYEYQSRAPAVSPERVAEHLDGLAGIRERMSYLVSYPPVRSHTRAEWRPAWPMLTLAALFAPALFAGAWALRRAARGVTKTTAESTPRLGGALITLAGLLIVLVAARAALLGHAGVPYTQSAWERVITLPRGDWLLGPLVLFAYLGRVVLFEAALLLAILLFERRRLFRAAFIALGVLQVALVFGEAPILAALGDVVSLEVFGARVVDCVVTLLLVVGWGLYLMLSRRAARTLVR